MSGALAAPIFEEKQSDMVAVPMKSRSGKQSHSSAHGALPADMDMRSSRCRAGAPDGRGGLDALSVEIKTVIFNFLPVRDLCSMCQVNRKYRQFCSGDPLWRGRATKLGISKGAEDQSWKWNFMAAVVGILHGKTFDDSNINRVLHLRGDMWIGDPMDVFFTGESNKGRWQQEFLSIVEELGGADAIITYRGIPSAVIHTAYGEGTYPVVRRNRVYGHCTSTSGMLAVVPRRLVKILEGENGRRAPNTGNVLVLNVDGRICTSRDGDFLIVASRPTKGVSLLLGSDWKFVVDVLVTTGGDWSLDTEDSSDEGEDDCQSTKADPGQDDAGEVESPHGTVADA
eukprot:TRINITY_DN23548_c0_g1_i1.p1 TRINITY_DN23548_c0_g1~~TRINITY_DN23548_c0_g1_i1.p1  ORF type:complete len:341 (+),score=44.03 TRINITY_DN23548_c0_g1_i1:260-1282(+)